MNLVLALFTAVCAFYYFQFISLIEPPLQSASKPGWLIRQWKRVLAVHVLLS